MIRQTGPYGAQMERIDPDTRFRDSMAAAIESVREEDQVGLALHFMVAGMEMLAHNSTVPSQKRICNAYADACRGLVPERIIVLAAAVKAGRGTFK